VACKYRAAWLADRVIEADILGDSFSKVKVCSVKRDPLSASGRWIIEVEQAKADSPTIFATGLAIAVQPPILDLNAKKRPGRWVRI
jgi:hypothetical protein